MKFNEDAYSVYMDISTERDFTREFADNFLKDKPYLKKLGQKMGIPVKHYPHPLWDQVNAAEQLVKSASPNDLRQILGFDINDVNKEERKMLSIKNVIFSNNDKAKKTIVFWSDGTKTVIGLAKGEVYDREKAIMAAYLKKIAEISCCIPDYKKEIFKYGTPERERLVTNLSETYAITVKEYALFHGMHKKNVIKLIHAGKIPDAELVYDPINKHKTWMITVNGGKNNGK